MLAGGIYERTSGAAGQPLAGYRRRTPERTVLHEVVARHAQTMFAEVRDGDGGGLPRYVERELAAALTEPSHDAHVAPALQRCFHLSISGATSVERDAWLRAFFDNDVRNVWIESALLEAIAPRNGLLHYRHSSIATTPPSC